MLELLAVALFAGLLFSAMVLWGVAVARVSRGQPILARDSHRRAAWGFVDILATVAVLIGLQLVAGMLLHRGGLVGEGPTRSLDDYFAALMSSAACSLGAFAISWIWLALRTGATPGDLGIRKDRVGQDLLIGGAAFLMLAPLVFGVQMVLVLIVGPTQHPLILLLQKSPEIRLFAAASLNAVIVAPIVEEYFFRGLWQGWTESLRLPLYGEELLFGRRPAHAVTKAGVLESSIDQPPLSDSQNPYLATIVEERPAPPDIPVSGAGERTIWWPIILSSLLFALAHVSHGPDGVALFVLAVGLGYLYQRTHSLLPSIVVHFLLNATSMLLLWIQLYLDN